MRHGTGWAATWLGVVLALATPARAEEKRWALLVGVDDYLDERISDLTGSVGDVEAIRDALVTSARFPSDQVFLLASDDPSSEPTTSMILARLDLLRKETARDDLVYIHFSLHAQLDEASGEYYLAARRADPGRFAVDHLAVSDLRRRIEDLTASKRLLVIDGCRNDPSKGRGDQPNRLDERFSRSLRIVPREVPASAVAFSETLFACGVGQRAYEVPGRDRGIFSWALEEGLRGAAGKDGRVTLGGLTTYVRSRVPELIELNLPGQEQTPEVSDPPPAARDYLLAESSAAPAAAQLKAADLQPVARKAATPVDDLEAILARPTDKPPTIRITDAPAAPLTRAQARAATIRFEVDVDVGVKAYRYRLNDGEIIDHKRSFVDLSLPEPGTHTFQVQAQDKHGNWSAPAKVELTVLPNRRPTVAFTSPKAGTRVDGERLLVELSGKDPDDDGRVVAYRLAIDDPEQFEQNASGAFSLPDPVDGPHTLYAQVMDDEGAWSLWQSLALTFRFKEPDRAPPPAATPTSSAATTTSANAHTWTKGQPAPSVEGFKLVGNNAQGYPEYDKDLGAGATMRFVLVPAGSFQMGSAAGDSDGYSDERPQHEVKLSAFLLAKTECTQAQWQAVMGSNPSNFKNAGPTAPVEKVSWTDIQGFEQKTGLTLPSEAQWEYAARGGTSGSHHGPIDAIAWYDGNAGGTTHPVGQKQANAFGLHDMSGNVWEWCEDTWHGDYAGAPTNGAPWVDSGSAYRVRRGGGWNSLAWGCRSAYRYGYGPGNRGNYLGCRLSRPLR